jgi:Carboxypeptidase regulatory-like domain/TonB dependent receptor
MTKLRRVLTAALIVLALAPAAFAQVTSAVLQGVVTDSQGGVLPGVTVTATNVETGLVREAPTDAAGFFRATALPPGLYTLQAALDGFTPYSRTGLVLTIGQTATVNVQLGQVSLTEAVTVEASAPLVDTVSNSLGTTVTRAQLEEIPLAGRNFASLANLAPGVTGVGGGGINAGGQLSRNNSVIVDGANNDEQAVAGERGSFSLESVREYVVYTNQFAAEHGQASGALVNVITRSGTNELQGRLFAFHRDDAFDAQNPFSKAQQSGKAPFSETRVGGFLGGPFARDRWHYFGSFEALRNETTNVVTSPLVPVSEREFPRDDVTDQYFIKSEYRFTSNQVLAARYRLDDAHQNGQGIGGLNLIERGYDYTARHQDAVMTLTSVISSRTVNEARVLYGRVHRLFSVDRFSDPLGVTINRPSGNFGKASNMPQGWDSIRYQFSNSLSHSVGRHDFKTGVDIQLDQTDSFFLGNKDGTFTFRTDAPFNPNDRSTYPFQYTRTIGDWFDPRQNQMYAAFAQDTWRATDAVTVNLGVRYDTETMFAKGRGIDVNQDMNNVAPRLGFVWSPSETARTVVRGGFGIYYDQGFNNISGNISNSARSTSVTVINPGFPDPYDGGTITPTRPSLTVAAPTIDTPSTRTLSFGAKRELFTGMALAVDVVRALGYNLFNANDINAAIPGTAVRPNPDFLRIVQYQTTGRSWHNGLLVSLERRAGRGPLFNISYTLSRQIRNVEDFGFTPQDPFNQAAERARANNDRRHQLVASAVWSLPGGVQAAGLIQTRSGLPWNVTTGSDNNGDTNVNDRPDLAVPDGDPLNRATYNTAFTGRVGSLGRNTNTGPTFVQVDMRLSKFIRIKRYSFEAFAEAFNLLNRANLGLPVGTLTSSSFGRATGLATNAAPRQVEFGFRFNF